MYFVKCNRNHSQEQIKYIHEQKFQIFYLLTFTTHCKIGAVA